MTVTQNSNDVVAILRHVLITRHGMMRLIGCGLKAL